MTVALASLVMLGLQAARVGGLGPPVAAVVLALAAGRFVPTARGVATWAATLAVAVATGLVWQVAMGVALGGYFAVAHRFPSVRPGPEWRRLGEVPIGPTLLVAGVTPIALVGWLLVVRPDLGDVVETYIPAGVPFAGLVLGAIGFVVVNAVLEELLWRGLLQDALGGLVGPGVAIGIQAASFGVQHANGVPRGLIGVAMVTLWGLMLGLLRRRSGGLLAPIVAHAVADTTIAAIVLSL